MIYKIDNYANLFVKRNKRQMKTYTFDFELSKEITARPLENKGFNKHFINLVSADVFKSDRNGFLNKIKKIFKLR